MEVKYKLKVFEKLNEESKSLIKDENKTFEETYNNMSVLFVNGLYKEVIIEGRNFLSKNTLLSYREIKWLLAFSYTQIENYVSALDYLYELIISMDVISDKHDLHYERSLKQEIFQFLSFLATKTGNYEVLDYASRGKAMFGVNSEEFIAKLSDEDLIFNKQALNEYIFEGEFPKEQPIEIQDNYDEFYTKYLISTKLEEARIAKNDDSYAHLKELCLEIIELGGSSTEVVEFLELAYSKLEVDEYKKIEMLNNVIL